MSMSRAAALASVCCLVLAACSEPGDDNASKSPGRATTVASTATTPTTGPGNTQATAPNAAPGGAASAQAFTPPDEADIPDDAFGAMVRKGRAIFTNTPEYAGDYAGNGLSCSNCHLNAGRLADSAPLWAAWGMYPKYRSKNDRVNSFTERLQGCFQYSMNGTAPPADSEIILALSSYAYWMAKGAPAGVQLPGASYPELEPPPQGSDYARGEAVFASHCALCHGDDGQGQKVAGRYVFPPLWGPDSYNWGAGMHRLNTAAGFIKANMPLGLGGSLSDQQAWDVARFIDSHERPQDPRFTGNVAQTRKRFHDSDVSLYGLEVNGHVLGSPAGSNPQ